MDALGASIVAGGALFMVSLVVISLFFTVFWIIELVDIVRRQFRDDVTKVLWFAIVFCSHVIGAIVYYFAGKQMGYLPGEAPRY